MTWRRLDSATGEYQPWYTHPALDEVQTWDVSDKVVLEYGGGDSTRWWARRCLHVHTVETDAEWYHKICAFGLGNVTPYLRAVADAASYASIPSGCEPGVIVIDGEHRSECLRVALAVRRPVTIIFDNWQQDFVYVDESVEAMMREHEGAVYVQPDHRNHAGRPWKTAIWHMR